MPALVDSLGQPCAVQLEVFEQLAALANSKLGARGSERADVTDGFLTLAEARKQPEATAVGVGELSAPVVDLAYALVVGRLAWCAGRA